MKIASWNVNSIKQRGDHVLDWLNDNKPDILMIQELKGLEFPSEKFAGAGYKSEFVSQKGNNGVAVIANDDVRVIHRSLPDNEGDEQARYLEVELDGHRLINIYAPNGNPVDSEKYDYKLKWMGHLEKHLERLFLEDVPFVIGGDFNIIPEPRDCHDPDAWADDALYRLPSRQIYRRLVNMGLTDAFRVYNAEDKQYTFWDYQAGAWPQNHGIRIDHFLLSPNCADRLLKCWIDKTPRGWDKPSDHTVIACEIAD